MPRQADLAAFDNDGCPHEHTTRWPAADPRLLPDNDPWAGTAPVYCRDCKDIVRRVPV